MTLEVFNRWSERMADAVANPGTKANRNVVEQFYMLDAGVRFNIVFFMVLSLPFDTSTSTHRDLCTQKFVLTYAQPSGNINVKTLVGFRNLFAKKALDDLKRGLYEFIKICEDLELPHLEIERAVKDYLSKRDESATLIIPDNILI